MINEAVLRLNLINANGMSIKTIGGETRSLDIVGIGENGLTGFVIENGQLVQIEGVIIGSAEKQDRVRRDIKAGIFSASEWRGLDKRWPSLQAETQKPPSEFSFLTYCHGRNAMEFVYQSACKTIDFESRSDIDMAFRMLFTAEMYLPSPVDDHLHRDNNTLVVQDFQGISSEVRYPRTGWVNPKSFDADALKDVNDAMHLLIQELKPSAGTDLELCFKRLFTLFQYLEVNE